ncbi:MAG: hypothetical protein ACKO2G_16290 [Verrucomicrobiales bacterium]
MPNPATKFAVLVLSLGLGAACIWNAHRGSRPVAPVTGTQTSAPAPAEKAATVTDEEVANHRDMLLRSSKSGIIMSDAAIRTMLEERKRAGATREGTQQLQYLIPSSKNPASVLNPAELKNLQESLPLIRQDGTSPPKEQSTEPPPAPEVLIPSSKSAPIFRAPEDLKNAVESITEPRPAQKE